jgi:transposase
METILARCAGLDMHKESVEACVRRIEPDGRVHSETRHWGTMTRDLLDGRRRSHECGHGVHGSVLEANF